LCEPCFRGTLVKFLMPHWANGTSYRTSLLARDSMKLMPVTTAPVWAVQCAVAYACVLCRLLYFVR
jgi:hypothetical protein